jgi:hypothetical protein
VYVPLHTEPPCDHGIISREFSEKVFNSASRYTICLPFLHDKSNDRSKECLGTGGHPFAVVKIRAELIQETKGTPCACTRCFGISSCP